MLDSTYNTFRLAS